MLNVNKNCLQKRPGNDNARNTQTVHNLCLFMRLYKNVIDFQNERHQVSIIGIYKETTNARCE